MTIDKVVLLGSEGSLPTVRTGGAAGYRINHGRPPVAEAGRMGEVGGQGGPGWRRIGRGGGAPARVAPVGAGQAGAPGTTAGGAPVAWLFVSAAFLGELVNFWDNDTTVTAAGRGLRGRRRLLA